MHTVYGEIGGGGSHRGGERLGDSSAAIDASSSGWVPEWPCVCKYILSKVNPGVSLLSTHSRIRIRGVEGCNTGPRSTTGVRSNTFSMGALE